VAHSDQLLEKLRAIYPPAKESLGVVALEIKAELRVSTITW
jgi:hypothetical protein